MVKHHIDLVLNKHQKVDMNIRPIRTNAKKKSQAAILRNTVKTLLTS